MVAVVAARWSTTPLRTRCWRGRWASRPDELEAELAERAAFLTALADRGICAPPDVAQAVAGYPSLPAIASEGASA